MDLTYVWAMRHRRISQYVNFRGILAGNLRSSVGRIVHEFQAEMSPTDFRGKQCANSIDNVLSGSVATQRR